MEHTAGNKTVNVEDDIPEDLLLPRKQTHYSLVSMDVHSLSTCFSLIAWTSTHRNISYCRKVTKIHAKNYNGRIQGVYK